MSTPYQFLVPGSEEQSQAIRGMMYGHAFEKHGEQLQCGSPEEFGAMAMRDLNTADRVLEVSQQHGPSLLFANSDSGTVGWINTSIPEESTYFSPRDGNSAYIDYVIARNEPSRELTPQEINEIRSDISLGPLGALEDGITRDMSDAPGR